MDTGPRRKWSQEGRGDITLVQLKTKVHVHILPENPCSHVSISNDLSKLQGCSMLRLLASVQAIYLHILQKQSFCCPLVQSR